MAKQYESVKSAKGKAMWFKVNTAVDTYEGNELGFAANVYFDEKTTAAMVEDCNKRLKDAQESKEFQNEKTGKPKKWLDNPFVPYATDDNDEVYFKFKTAHVRKDADGNDVKRYVPVFDAKGKPMGRDVAIGNGSVVKISYSPSLYHVNSNINGIKFFLNAIQVLDLVEFGNSNDGSAFGFAEEEGYEAPVTEDTIEDPFVD